MGNDQPVTSGKVLRFVVIAGLSQAALRAWLPGQESNLDMPGNGRLLCL
jgi:hypothetical protein